MEITALADRFPGDAFLRWQSATGAGSAAWALGGAWARLDSSEGRSRLVAGGNAADAAALVAAVVPDRATPDRVSVVREAVPLLPAGLAPVGGDDWDWFATTAPPPQRLPGEDRASPVDVTDPAVLEAVLDLLHGHSPRYSRDPRQADATWWAIPDPDRPDGLPVAFVAVAAVEQLPRAVHLASIATRTDRRGQGLGSALTAAVTRAALADGCDAVVLGMYADNDPARRMYHRLGFVDTHRWRSGYLAGRG